MDKEFDIIISELKKAFESKDELPEKEGTSYPKEKTNLLRRISSLEKSGKDIFQNYNGNQNMLINFKKRASEIMTEIETLK